MANDFIDNARWEFAAQRANYYRYLARLYYEELTDDLIEELANTQSVIALDDDMDELERELALGTNKMVKFVTRRNSDTKTRSKVDYANIFLGYGSTQQRPVSPFESVYTSEERLLMQESRDDFYKILRAEGLALDDHYNMPEDHIAFEFQYMAHLLDSACAAHAQGKEALALKELERQGEFFNNHIVNWVERFCEDALEIAKTQFYQGLLQATKAWVAMEAQDLEVEEVA